MRRTEIASILQRGKIKMDKLTYLPKSNSVIEIDLHNGFSVVVFETHQPEANRYIITLYLKKYSINLLDLIEEQEAIEIYANGKTIHKKILKYVANLLSKDYFHYYIQRYNYMLRCFDKGNELIENERLSGVCE